jgi:hypothetical protein
MNMNSKTYILYFKMKAVIGCLLGFGVVMAGWGCAVSGFVLWQHVWLWMRFGWGGATFLTLLSL